MARKAKTFLVSAQNAGTINGKKTTTLPADIDRVVNGMGVDVQSVSVAPAGPHLAEQVLVTVIYEGQEESSEKKKK